MRVGNAVRVKVRARVRVRVRDRVRDRVSLTKSVEDPEYAMYGRLV